MKAVGVSHERVSDAEGTRSLPSSNAIGFSFERERLLVRTGLTFRSN